MENAEKVVKPPQKPVISNNLISGLTTELFSANEKKMPIKKHPIIFTESVPSGNTEG